MGFDPLAVDILASADLLGNRVPLGDVEAAVVDGIHLAARVGSCLDPLLEVLAGIGKSV